MSKTASHGEARKSLENEQGTKSEVSSNEKPIPDSGGATSIRGSGHSGSWVCGSDILPVKDAASKSEVDEISEVESGRVP